jgi:leucyl-tRNA synthetase
MDPRNKKAFADKKAIQYWKHVDMYVGGAEHATGHILYARFWHKFLKDLGLVPTEEPFQTWKTQGMIMGTDGRKMSKRWGNIVNPDEVVKNFGADTLRVYEMFMGPFEASLPWSTDNIVGSRRFVERVWKLTSKVTSRVSKSLFDKGGTTAGSEQWSHDRKKMEMIMHQTVKKVTEDIDHFAFNTAVSAMMIAVNEMEKIPEIAQKDFELFLKILSPFAPHVAEELWHTLGHTTFIVTEKWPQADPKKMQSEEVIIVVQVNGKVRGQILCARDMSDSDVSLTARQNVDVDKWLTGKEIVKTIHIPNRLVNFVVRQ